MITELTKEQIDLMPIFVERYVKIGLCTDPIDKVAAQAYTEKLYSFLGRKAQPQVIFTEGLISAWKAVMASGESQVGSQVLPQVDSQVGSQVWSQVDSQVWSQVSSQIDSQVESQVRSQVRSQVWSQVRSQIESQVRSQVWSQVWSQVESQVKGFIWPYLSGQFWASYVAYLDFFKEIGVSLSDYSILKDQLQFNLIYPLDNVCIFSERPIAIHMKNKRLHKDGSPSIEFKDGTKCWNLNGVSVPQWLAETPHHKIDCSEFPKIQNAEVRREFIRKVGVERVCQELGSTLLDKQGDYELHEIDLKGTTGKWPYLKMLNPSIGVWHMECVDKACRTVKEALTFRNQSSIVPEVLT